MLNTIKRLFEPYRLARTDTARGMVTYFLRWILPVIGVLFTKYLIWILEAWNYEVYFMHLYGIGGAVVVYFIVRFMTVNKWWVRGFRVYEKVIRNIYLKKVLYINNNAFEHVGTGNMLSIVDRGSQSRAWILVNILSTSSAIVITLMVNIYFIYIINPLFALIFLLVVGIILYIWIKADQKVKQFRNLRREARREWMRGVVKLLMSKFDVLQNNKINYELWMIADTSDQEIAANTKMWPYSEVFFLWPQLMVYILVVLFFVFWWRQIIAWEMTISFFYWVVSSLFMLQWILERTLGTIKDMSKNWADVEKLWELVDNTPQIIGLDNGRKYSFQQWKIELVWVTFWYWDELLFEDFSYVVEPWKRTALVGSSWWWKSTLIKLIAWYLQVNSWSVLVDGQKLPSDQADKKSISLKSYYKNIWYLTQEPSVFDGTIYDNLIYALDYKPKKKQLDEVIEKAQCQFIYDMPKGLDTYIGEKWIKLSWWQRQRLAIAKIFLKNPNIILLDEPTSALDSLSEEAITKALDILFTWRTVVIIAHRLQTVKKADSIVVLEKWKIIEVGTHERLAKAWWTYAKMLELQSWF
jgi:ATP-binding cassette, subfamily B, bacterial